MLTRISFAGVQRSRFRVLREFSIRCWDRFFGAWRARTRLPIDHQTERVRYPSNLPALTVRCPNQRDKSGTSFSRLSSICPRPREPATHRLFDPCLTPYDPNFASLFRRTKMLVKTDGRSQTGGRASSGLTAPSSLPKCNASHHSAGISEAGGAENVSSAESSRFGSCGHGDTGLTPSELPLVCASTIRIDCLGGDFAALRAVTVSPLDALFDHSAI